MFFLFVLLHLHDLHALLQGIADSVGRAIVEGVIAKDPIVLTWSREIKARGLVSRSVHFPGEDSLQLCSPRLALQQADWAQKGR